MNKKLVTTTHTIYLIIVTVYIAGMFIGLYFPKSIGWNTLLQVSDTPNKGHTFIDYFINNFNVSYLTIFLGAFTLGFYTIYICFFNGYILGYGINILTTFGLQFLVLPHGIFEVSAFIISCSMPLRFSIAVLKKRSIKCIPQAFIVHIFNFRLWAIIIILLLLAAVIEAKITPLFI